MIIAMRHAATDWNAQQDSGSGGAEILRGNIDVPINAAGAQKAQESAALICQRYPVQEVRGTPQYQRITQTRHIVAQVCGVPEVDAPEFAPWDPGTLSGKPLEAIADIIGLLMDIPFIPAPGGDAYGDYVNNFQRVWQKVYAEYGQDDSRAVVLILFGNEFRVLPMITRGEPIEQYSQQKVKPGDFVVIH